jgi:hypothetical protein
MSGEDLRGELQVRLLERLRGQLTWDAYEQPGKEATYVFLDRERNAMRKRNRIYDATVSLGNLPATCADSSPTPDVLVEWENTRSGIRASLAAARHEMTARQESWFGSFLDDIENHGSLNEARVAELRGRDRSSACHAKSAIRAALRSKLDPALIDELGLREEPDTQGTMRNRRSRARGSLRHRDSDGFAAPPLLVLRLDERFAKAPRVPRLWPQPPWLDEGDQVTLAKTGASGIVLGADRFLAGMVYRVRVLGQGRVVELLREDLLWVPRAEVPF